LLPLVIIDDLKDMDRLIWSVPSELSNEPELIIKSHGILTVPITLKFLKVKRA